MQKFFKKLILWKNNINSFIIMFFTFGKKKNKVIKLKNNKTLGSKLQGYTNGAGLIAVKIKGKVYSKRIKRGKNYFKITIKGRNYQCKQKERAHVTLVALKRKSSFGKKKNKVIKLKNNKTLGSKLQGYANGLGLIALKIKGKVYHKRIKRGTKKGYFKITIKGKNYHYKQKQRGYVTLVALKRKTRR